MFGSWLGGWTTEQATINERGVRIQMLSLAIELMTTPQHGVI